ncbi:TPA: DnaB-like helicase C-terminal domain-containing protein [Citrobacter freundii]|uniref:DnaB-like helicase C-terminal domain-containing protein n=1 Tax=Enterobacterales TaxID=91347 RepID=UPI0005EEC7C5|nr:MULTISPECIES: DnaB-like helicase C-terminal domain-containing protein [Enterobacterales]ECC3316182.1 helicase DnaB [Salmonella enterica subsp. enterica]EEA8717031.1 AAA family ATPase [Salmonella enterica subsp. enterica serovar Lexington]EKH8809716.1 AAA family ATPase [Salmonella enterica]MDK4558933.1 AAA family ATPase [Citrobacter freundii]HBM0956811.1 AAA family ATPase [Enterobacter roggenkampii]HCD8000844.1 AAA family ATPase [Escherichia coli]HCT3688845.1 AAA family ATPase [Enterobacte
MTDMNMIPQNIEAEQSVLGGMMLDSGSDRCQTAMSMLKPESFYIRPHQVIFAEMRELVANQKPIDLITLIESLESKGLGEQAGGFAYMAEISKNTPSAANIVHYAMLVREKAMERYGIDKLTSATELLYSRNGMTTSQKFDAIQTLFTDIADYAKTGNRRGLREFSEVMGDWVDEVEARWSDSDATRGLSTGIGSLDDLLQPKGLVKGALMVIGARPKMGKTTLYSQLAVNCAEVEQLPALMFSLEMPDKQIVERMIGQVSRVNTDVFYGDRYDDAQVAMAFAAGGRLAQTGNLYVDDTPGITLAHIVAESRRIKRERGAVGMVLVDYLTLMTADKADRNDLAYGIITKGLKNLAKELNCIVVLLTQLNRDLEKRTNKRPMPSDSRDTGQIEQDCDYWIGIYREGAYDENADQAATELLLRLNRHGPTGVVYCDQRNGAIYDCDQAAAEQKRRANDARPNKKREF